MSSIHQHNRTKTTNIIPFIIISSTALSLSWMIWSKQRRRSKSKSNIQKSYEECIGTTPLIHLPKLSSMLGNGNNIYVKMECFNPGGTGKDRAALYMLRHAESNGDLPPPVTLNSFDSMLCSSGCKETTTSIHDNGNQNNGTETDSTVKSHNVTEDLTSTIHLAVQRSKTGGIVIEGTSGSTGISLSTLSTQRGHSTIIVMPDDQSQEKQTILKCLGAILYVVPTAAISNPNHYVNVARKIANEINKRRIVNDRGQDVKAAFMNQFENEANYSAHYVTTGPEVYEQTKGKIDMFCMSSGTGGTCIA